MLLALFDLLSRLRVLNFQLRFPGGERADVGDVGVKHHGLT